MFHALQIREKNCEISQAPAIKFLPLFDEIQNFWETGLKILFTLAATLSLYSMHQNSLTTVKSHSDKQFSEF